MNNLIIDATTDKIVFLIINNIKSYSIEFTNNRENFDKLSILIFDFLHKNDLKIDDIKNILVNQGPGKYSSVRASLSTAKALCFVNKINLYGFDSKQIISNNYTKIIDLLNQGLLEKNNIKPIY
tara:strand:- start:194 stop:565 length:372 start_codon:yes stop_codon:yes gene_type:complete